MLARPRARPLPLLLLLLLLHVCSGHVLLRGLRSDAASASWSRAARSRCCATKRATLFPAWPEGTGKSLDVTLEAFGESALDVPLKASKEDGDGWRVWADAGYDAQRLVAAKLSRQTYVAVLTALCGMMVTSQRQFPDLYAVVKFIPKKNGLNPHLAQVGAAPQRRKAWPPVEAAAVGERRSRRRDRLIRPCR